MLRVVIADDERNICVLLKRLIDWQALDLTLAGEAHGGTAAWTLIVNERPDIAILDIKMPGIDGLEIVRRAQSAGLATKFLLISGHKNFAYAHTALKYGVEWYLLKPINRDELNETLGRIAGQIVADQEDRAVIEHIKGRLKRNEETNRKRFLYALMSSDLNQDMTLDAINQAYDLRFEPGAFCLLVIKPDGKTAYEASQLDILLNQLKSFVDAFFEADSTEAIVLKLSDEISVLVNYPSAQTLKQAVYRCFEQASKKFYPYGKLTIALSTPVDDPLAIKPEQARRAGLYRLSLGPGRVIEYEKCRFAPLSLRGSADQKAFLNAFDALNTKPVDDWMDRVRARVAPADVDPYDLYRDLTHLVATLIHERLSDVLDADALAERKKNDLFRLSSAATKPALLDAFYDVFAEALSLYIANQKRAGSKYIQMAKQYVDEHYGENVVLEDIAGTIFINPVYLSILFKKEEGKNFSEYLTEYRMERAKELLSVSNGYNMEQISRMVGYQDARYFSKLFTRIVGIKPSDYRRLH